MAHITFTKSALRQIYIQNLINLNRNLLA